MSPAQAQRLDTARQRLRNLKLIQKEVGDLGERLIRTSHAASFYRRLPPSRNSDAEEMRRMILKRCETEMDIYTHRRTALERELCVLTEYIDSIPDSALRQVFTLYYLDGLTWYEVSVRLNKCGDALRIRHDRWLANHGFPDEEGCS